MAIALAAAGNAAGRAIILTELARRPAAALIDALAALDEPEDGARIARHAADPDPAVRAAVAVALADLDARRYRPVLTRLAGDEAPQVAAAARAGLAD